MLSVSFQVYWACSMVSGWKIQRAALESTGSWSPEDLVASTGSGLARPSPATHAILRPVSLKAGESVFELSDVLLRKG